MVIRGRDLQHLSGHEVVGKDVYVGDDIAGQQVLDGCDVWVEDQLTIHSVNAAGLRPMGRRMERFAAGELHRVRRIAARSRKPRFESAAKPLTERGAP